MVEWIFLPGFHFVQWNQLAPPSASHLWTRLGVVWGRSGYPCHSIPRESQPSKMYFTTLWRYISPFWLCTCPKLSPITHCLTCSVFLTSQYCLCNSSQSSGCNVAKSIQPYQPVPIAAWPHMPLTYWQPLSPSAGVYHKAVSHCSAPKSCHNTFSLDTQPPILSSTCWPHCSWTALSCRQIASRNIPVASGWLLCCLWHIPTPTNYHLHHPHRIPCRRAPANVASLQSLQFPLSDGLVVARILSFGTKWRVFYVHQNEVLVEKSWKLLAKWLDCFPAVRGALSEYLERMALIWKTVPGEYLRPTTAALKEFKSWPLWPRMWKFLACTGSWLRTRCHIQWKMLV